MNEHVHPVFRDILNRFPQFAKSHDLPPEALQELADDFTAEMKQEARERRESEE